MTDYSFLTLHSDGGARMIFRGVVGSRAYGTDRPGGDEDESAPAPLLFVGIPASGKSTFYHRVLGEDRNLDYVSLDMLGTRAREDADRLDARLRGE